VLRATLRSLAAHKLRLLLSGVAVVLGVAFVAGTLVFTDTLQRTFEQLFTQTTTDVVVTPEQEFQDTSGLGGVTATLPADLVDTVRGVDGMAKAEGIVFTAGVTIIGSDGEPVGVMGAPAFGSNWSDDPDLSPYRLTDGRGPAAEGEVAIDSQSAETGGLAVGDPVTLITPGPRVTAEVVGVFRYGTSGNLAGASIAAFSTAAAQQLLPEPGFTSIEGMAAEGVSQEELAARVQAALPAGVRVQTGAEVADEQAAALTEGLQFINVFLLVFAFVALFVGTFLILNTFSMLVAQRTRELALLRAVGATRAQVTRSVLGEAAIVGLLGGLTGLGVGILLAVLLQRLFALIGFELPSEGLVVAPRTVLVAVLLGLVTTVVAAYLPARRASRTPPVAAMRSDVALPARSLHRRAIAGSVLFLGGVAALASSPAAEGRQAAALVGLGALLCLVGAIVLGPVAARPAVRLIGAVFARSATGRIAVQNAGRNPRRTATTAVALMIGLTLVTAFGVLGASTTASTDAVIDDVVRTDYLVSSRNFLPFTPEVATAVAEVDGVGLVSAVRVAPALVDGAQTVMTGVDPATIADVLALELTQGSLADLEGGGLLVDDGQAVDLGYRLGQQVPVAFQTGPTSLRVVGTYASTGGFSGYVVASSTLDEAGLTPLDQALYVQASPGTDAAGLRPALETAIEPFPVVQLQDQTEFKAQIRQQVNQLLTLIYALLGLAVLIAVLGIVNTLVLSVVERTREIGLLRAVGTTRRQLRGMIRVESVVIAVFGAMLGIVLGLGFGVALQRAIADQGIRVLSIPWGLLVAFFVVSGVVGVLAALWPARRAARLDVLQAVTTE
jgi:putative ABC transport system permease protein